MGKESRKQQSRNMRDGGKMESSMAKDLPTIKTETTTRVNGKTTSLVAKENILKKTI